jgi:spermidine/putrescine-binding protein
MMRKTIYLMAAALVLTGLLLAGCGGTATPDTGGEAPPADIPTLIAPAFDPVEGIVIYNWSEYIDPEIYADFQEQTGIEIAEDNFSSNEELRAKLEGGATSYAVIVPSDYTVTIMKQNNMLAKLDHGNIPNLSNLAERFRNLPYDPGNEYCVPYQWGTVGIGYLEGEVDTPTSWAVLFDPDPNAPYYGRMTMLDDAREGFSAALIYLGYDINTTVEGQLQQAKELLIRAKGALSGFDSDTFEDLVVSEENLMAHGWNGDFRFVQEENEKLKFVIPNEGGVIWVDNLCIPATVVPEQKAAAETFINYLLNPEVGAQLSEWNYYASPNAASEDLLGEQFLSDPAVYPPEAVLDRLQFIRSVGEGDVLFERLWDEVKSAPVP